MRGRIATRASSAGWICPGRIATKAPLWALGAWQKRKNLARRKFSHQVIGGFVGVLACLWPVGVGCSAHRGVWLPAAAEASGCVVWADKGVASAHTLPSAAAAPSARERGGIRGGLRGGREGGEGREGRFALSPASTRDAFVYASESPGCAARGSGDEV